MQIATREIADYDSSASTHILFLHFNFEERNGKEKVKLESIRAGNGRLKNMGPGIHSVRRIRAEVDYGSKIPMAETFFEHPLFREVEVPSSDGRLERRQLNEKEGVLLVRIQEDQNLKKLTLFSEAPGRAGKIIYEIDFER